MNHVEDLEKLATLHTSGVLTDDEFAKAKKRIVGHIADPNKAPAWMKPFGYYACLIALVCAALVGYHHYEKSRGDHVEVLMGIALNPLVFVVLPLGLYWLHRAGELPRPDASPPHKRMPAVIPDPPDASPPHKRMPAVIPDPARAHVLKALILTTGVVTVSLTVILIITNLNQSSHNPSPVSSTAAPPPFHLDQEEWQDPKAEKYESKAGKFKIHFPDKPTVSTKQAPSPIGKLNFTMITWQPKKGDRGIIVSFVDYPVEKSKFDVQKGLDGGVDGAVKASGSRLDKSDKITWGADKIPGRSFLIENAKAKVWAKNLMIIKDVRMYHVMVIGPKDFATGKEADAALASFELVK